MDRCALFVDAGYVLADGAMAVHGTRRRESVSWDYPGLLQLLASLATERSGLPLLRCYWYEATAEGQRSAEHDLLADLPGVKLRLAKTRPGRREGVESEIRRDLTTLARNKAVSDAMVVSAEEDLAQVIADVQDMGMRVSLLHLAVDGNGTVPRALRQECDDVMEMSGGHLRPYVELISGAEPPRPDERDASLVPLRIAANGSNGNGRGASSRTAAYPPSARSYQEEFGADWDELAPGEPDAVRAQSARVEPMQPYREAGPGRQGQAMPRYGSPAADFGYPAEAAQDPGAVLEPPVAPDFTAARRELTGVRQDTGQERQDGGPRQVQAAEQPLLRPEPPVRPESPVRPEIAARQELYPAPVALPGPAEQQIVEDAAAQSRGMADLSGYNPGAVRDQLPLEAMTREPVPVNAGQVRRLPARGIQAGPAPVGPAQAGPAAPGQPAGTGQPGLRPAPAGLPPVPQAGAGYGPAASVGQLPAGPVGTVGPMGLAVAGGPPGLLGPAVLAGGQQPGPGGPSMPNPAGPPEPAAAQQQDASGALAAAGQALESSGPIGPVGPVGYSGGQPGISLADAVQSAHEEGQEFGDSVARDAPALWLEAVLARKPRMPSDLEARLLQGSALPIDYLLHDEVRHALRRGFWDAMERARR